MRIHISLLWIPISILWIHISALLCATASIHIYLYCEYKLYIKMHRCMYTYISIVDRYINLKMCHCMYINQTEQGNLHTRAQVQQIYHQYRFSPLSSSTQQDNADRVHCSLHCPGDYVFNPPILLSS